jgi:hypothetical protein
VKKNKLFQGDVDAIREIAQDRKKSLVKREADDLLVRFRRKIDPEMKDRLKDVTAEEFEQMLDALDRPGSGKTSRRNTFSLRWAQVGLPAMDQFLLDIQEGLKRPSDEVFMKAVSSLADETSKKASLEEVWFRRVGLAQVAPTQSAKTETAEKYFFDNPEKRETREFAQAGNSTKREQAEGAPPTVKDIEKSSPGSVAVSTLSRFLIQTEEPVSRATPQSREEIPKHPKIASRLEQIWFKKG